MSSTSVPQGRRISAVVGFVAALTLLVTLVSPASPALAVTYPSWQDVQNAKSDTAAAAAEVSRIQTLIAGLEAAAAEAQAVAEARGAELEIAQQQFDDAARRAADLKAQADESQAAADTATRQAGQLAAQLYRTGGTDLSVNLFMSADDSGEDADALLSKLGSMSKLVERSSTVYEQAQTATNTAKSLGDQADVAEAERETLRIAAEAAMVIAQTAFDAASAALAESEERRVELDAQLAFMQDTEATTTASYEAGQAEKARLAAEAAAAAAAAAAAGGASSGAGPGLGGGFVSSQGWAVPASGRITGTYGPRPVICTAGGCSSGYHYGTDMAAALGTPIYAANGGTVTYAGWFGTYGNFVLIDHGNGIQTSYAHIRSGGIFVANGQQVSVGQNIASMGSTGASTGSHLHFEVRRNGSRINPVPFMADRGAALG